MLSSTVLEFPNCFCWGISQFFNNKKRFLKTKRRKRRKKNWFQKITFSGISKSLLAFSHKTCSRLVSFKKSWILKLFFLQYFSIKNLSSSSYMDVLFRYIFLLHFWINKICEREISICELFFRIFENELLILVFQFWIWEILLLKYLGASYAKKILERLGKLNSRLYHNII